MPFRYEAKRIYRSSKSVLYGGSLGDAHELVEGDWRMNIEGQRGAKQTSMKGSRSRSTGNDSRALLRRTNELLRENPDLAVEYNLMRNQARKLRVAGSYDITSRCNLWCEGCYYFSGDQHALKDETNLQRWKDHFRAERDRGVTFAYIAGAEPAMEQERLFAVHDNIPNGTIASNGTIMIDKAISYRIIISVWGDEDLTKELRGGGTFWKALRLYGSDERALFAYTITKQNIRQLPKVLDILSKEGVEVAFNMYSPTIQYLQKLKSAEKK